MATLITSHNRASKTLRCLELLESQNLEKNVSNTVYILDDGSTDGSPEEIKQKYPYVNLFHGDGNYYWCRGMHKIFYEAIKKDFDFYLWLNDDTYIFPNALRKALDSYNQINTVFKNPLHIISGSTQDPVTQKLSYGGLVRSSLWHPLRFGYLQPNVDKPLECVTMNGNFVLLPREIVQLVGNLDPTFHHCKGDFDYGLRAKKKGVRIWICPGFIGTCFRDHKRLSIPHSQKNIKTYINYLKHPKSGMNPRETLTYVKRHGGPFWFLFWPLAYFGYFYRCFSKKIKDS